jgi:hypothetical protein
LFHFCKLSPKAVNSFYSLITPINLHKMLSEIVETNSAIDIAPQIMCHSATVYWLYMDEFQRAPSLDDFLAPGISPPAPVIQAMLGLGNQITSANALRGLTPGTVIVFVQNGEPMHSCVAIGGQRIGGYNQTGWFTSAGIGGAYTSHAMADVQWLDGLMNRNKVRGSNDRMQCTLYGIPENSAKAILRQAVQTPRPAF